MVCLGSESEPVLGCIFGVVLGFDRKMVNNIEYVCVCRDIIKYIYLLFLPPPHILIHPYIHTHSHTHISLLLTILFPIKNEPKPTLITPTLYTPVLYIYTHSLYRFTFTPYFGSLSLPKHHLPKPQCNQR